MQELLRYRDDQGVVDVPGEKLGEFRQARPNAVGMQLWRDGQGKQVYVPDDRLEDFLRQTPGAERLHTFRDQQGGRLAVPDSRMGEFRQQHGMAQPKVEATPVPTATPTPTPMPTPAPMPAPRPTPPPPPVEEVSSEPSVRPFRMDGKPYSPNEMPGVGPLQARVDLADDLTGQQGKAIEEFRKQLPPSQYDDLIKGAESSIRKLEGFRQAGGYQAAKGNAFTDTLRGLAGVPASERYAWRAWGEDDDRQLAGERERLADLVRKRDDPTKFEQFSGSLADALIPPALRGNQRYVTAPPQGLGDKVTRVAGGVAALPAALAIPQATAGRLASTALGKTALTFMIHGQTHMPTTSTFEDRAKGAATDAVRGALFTGIGVLGQLGPVAEQLTPVAKFSLGYGMALAGGAEQEDAIIGGATMAILHYMNKPGSRTSARKELEKHLTRQYGKDGAAAIMKRADAEVKSLMDGRDPVKLTRQQTTDYENWLRQGQIGPAIRAHEAKMGNRADRAELQHVKNLAKQGDRAAREWLVWKVGPDDVAGTPEPPTPWTMKLEIDPARMQRASVLAEQMRLWNLGQRGPGHPRAAPAAPEGQFQGLEVPPNNVPTPGSAGAGKFQRLELPAGKVPTPGSAAVPPLAPPPPVDTFGAGRIAIPDVPGLVRGDQAHAARMGQAIQTPPPATESPAVNVQKGSEMPAEAGASPVPVEEQESTTAPDWNETPVQAVRVADIKLSDDVPQFKGEASKKTGVVEPLAGEFVKLGTGPIVVWERTGGELEIITGRHRFDLAKRSGTEYINAQVVREADGYTQEMAELIDAESNIRDGQGSVKDFANFFRRKGYDEQAANERGLLSREKGRSGFAIGAYAEDALYDSFANRGITEARAVAIARGAPRNAQIQEVLIGKARELSPDELYFLGKSLTREQQFSTTQGTQMGLFGDEFNAVLEEETLIAKETSKAKNQNRELRGVLNQALKRGGKLELTDQQATEVGIQDKNSAEQIEAALSVLQQEALRLDHIDTDRELRDVMRVRAGLKPVGQPGGNADFQLEGETREEYLARQAQAGKPAPTEPTETPMVNAGKGDLGQMSFLPEDQDLFNQPGPSGGSGPRAFKEPGAGGDVVRPEPEPPQDGTPPGEMPADLFEQPPKSEPLDWLPGPIAPTDVWRILQASADGRKDFVKVQESMRGHVLGMFHPPKGKQDWYIEILARTAQLIQPEDEARLRAEAGEWGQRRAGSDGPTAEKLARERYDELRAELYAERLMQEPEKMWMVLVHEAYHRADWKDAEGRYSSGNVLAHIGNLVNYTKKLLPHTPDAWWTMLTAKDKDRMRRSAERMAQAAAGGGHWEEIIREVPIFAEANVAPQDILSVWNSMEPTVTKEVYRYIQALGRAEKADIIRQAMQGVVDEQIAKMGGAVQTGTETVVERVFKKAPPATKAEILKRYREMLKQEIKKRKLFEENVITDELERLIAWDFQQNLGYNVDGMPAYFRASEEMYVQAASVLIRHPAETAARAPNFYQAFANWRYANPQWDGHMQAIVREMRAGTTQEARLAHNLQMQKEAEQRIVEQRDAMRFLTPAERWDHFVATMVSNAAKYNSLVQKVRKRLGHAEGDKFDRAIRDWRYGQDKVYLHTTDMVNSVMEPLQQAGVSREIFNQYLEAKLYSTHRADKINPEFKTSKTALDLDQHLRETFGDQAYAAMERAEAARWELRNKHVFDLLDKLEVGSPEIRQLIRDRVHYSTMSIIMDSDTPTGEWLMTASAAAKGGNPIHKSVGTAKQNAPVDVATLEMDIRLIKWALEEHAKKTVVDICRVCEIPFTEADMRWDPATSSKQPVVLRGNKHFSTISYDHNGKKYHFNIPVPVANMFTEELHPSGLAGEVLDTIYKVTRTFKDAVTRFTPGFAFYINPVIDYQSAIISLPGRGPVRLVKYLKPANEAAISIFNGKPNDLARMALEEYPVIMMREGNVKKGMSPLEAVMAKAGIRKPAETKVGKAIESHLRLAAMFEMRTKIASIMFLRENFPDLSPAAIQHMVQERGGSNEYLTHPAFQIIGNILPFFNANVRGNAAVYDSFKEIGEGDPSRSHLLIKSIAAIIGASVIPLLLEREGPEELRKMYTAISERDKSNYICIPIGWDDRENWKVRYLTIPILHPLRPVIRAIRNVINGIYDDDYGRVFNIIDSINYGADSLPGLNPVITLMPAIWDQLRGNIPKDRFGREIYHKDRQGTAGAWLRFTHYGMSELGGSAIWRYSTESRADPNPTPLQEFLSKPIVSSSISRVLRVTNQGYRDRKAHFKKQLEAPEAEVRRSIRRVMADMRSSGRIPRDGNVNLEGMLEGRHAEVFGLIGRGQAVMFENSKWRDLILDDHESYLAAYAADFYNREIKSHIIDQQPILDRAFIPGGGGTQHERAAILKGGLYHADEQTKFPTLD